MAPLAGNRVTSVEVAPCVSSVPAERQGTGCIGSGADACRAMRADRSETRRRSESTPDEGTALNFNASNVNAVSFFDHQNKFNAESRFTRDTTHRNIPPKYEVPIENEIELGPLPAVAEATAPRFPLVGAAPDGRHVGTGGVPAPPERC